MERSVKTDLSRSPTALFHGGVRSQSARAAGLVRGRSASPSGPVRFPFDHAFAAGLRAVRQHEARSLLLRGSGVDIRGEIEARVSSPERRDPSFYLGLFWPWLLLELRGGIACRRDIRLCAPMPALQGILTLEPTSSPGTAPTSFHSSWIEASARETSYELGLRYFVGSYFSLLFHIERTIAASLRAIVSFARFGFVPAAISRW